MHTPSCKPHGQLPHVADGQRHTNHSGTAGTWRDLETVRQSIQTWDATLDVALETAHVPSSSSWKLGEEGLLVWGSGLMLATFHFCIVGLVVIYATLVAFHVRSALPLKQAALNSGTRHAKAQQQQQSNALAGLVDGLAIGAATFLWLLLSVPGKGVSKLAQSAGSSASHVPSLLQQLWQQVWHWLRAEEEWVVDTVNSTVSALPSTNSAGVAIGVIAASALLLCLLFLGCYLARSRRQRGRKGYERLKEGELPVLQGGPPTHVTRAHDTHGAALPALVFGSTVLYSLLVWFKWGAVYAMLQLMMSERFGTYPKEAMFTGLSEIRPQGFPCLHACHPLPCFFHSPCRSHFQRNRDVHATGLSTRVRWRCSGCRPSRLPPRCMRAVDQTSSRHLVHIRPHVRCDNDRRVAHTRWGCSPDPHN